MADDIEARVVKLEVQVAAILEGMRETNGDMEERMRKLERTVWTASGGVIVAQAIFLAVMVASVKGIVGV